MSYLQCIHLTYHIHQRLVHIKMSSEVLTEMTSKPNNLPYLKKLDIGFCSRQHQDSSMVSKLRSDLLTLLRAFFTEPNLTITAPLQTWMESHDQ